MIASMIIMTPLFQIQFPMQTIAGFSIIQAIFATFFGALHYYRERLLDWPVICYLGFPALVGGVIGSFLSHLLSDGVLKIIFACMAFLASFSMIFPTKNMDQNHFTPEVPRGLAVMLGLTTGLIGGLIGVAAGFVFVPLQMYLFHISVKKSIGNSLVICFLVSCGSFIPKLTMDAIPLMTTIAIVTGAVLGSQIGGMLNKTLQSKTLKNMVAFIIAVISIRIFYDIFAP